MSMALKMNKAPEQEDEYFSLEYSVPKAVEKRITMEESLVRLPVLIHEGLTSLDF